MDPWLVLVSPCFRENVVATCKIGCFFFLCSLGNLLQKNVIVLFFGKQFSKWHSFEKKSYFWPTFHIFSHQGKLQKFLQHIAHSHTYTYFAHPFDFFYLTNFEKNTNLSDTVSLWYESWCWFLFASFCNNQLITKWWATFKLECLLLICVYTNAKFIVFCKPQTLNVNVKIKLSKKKSWLYTDENDELTFTVSHAHISHNITGSSSGHTHTQGCDKYCCLRACFTSNTYSALPVSKWEDALSDSYDKLNVIHS